MKALTAFRNVLKRRGTIESTVVHHLLCSDDEIHFIVKFKYFPTREGKSYEAFVKARQESLKFPGKG